MAVMQVGCVEKRNGAYLMMMAGPKRERQGGISHDFMTMTLCVLVLGVVRARVWFKVL
jgi:hypothetical protein